MIAKFIGAAAGKAAANHVGRRLGGSSGALIGFGLASRRFRKLAIAGLAFAAGKALYDRYRESANDASDAPAGADPLADTTPGTGGPERPDQTAPAITDRPSDR